MGQSKWQLQVLPPQTTTIMKGQLQHGIYNFLPPTTSTTNLEMREMKHHHKELKKNYLKGLQLLQLQKRQQKTKKTPYPRS